LLVLLTYSGSFLPAIRYSLSVPSAGVKKRR